MNTPDLIKYPRTEHIEGSRLQVGDHDLNAVKFNSLTGRHLVVEEKMDGANAAIRFSGDGHLFLQSRGHYLTGGAREKHFAMFKTWAETHQQTLFKYLTDRYVLFGEWLYAKHTIFYDRLPHYFMEFDLLDTRTGQFLDTPSRHSILAGSPIVSVKVLESGSFKSLNALTELVAHSNFISELHRTRLRELVTSQGLDEEHVLRQTDRSKTMEGLYVKVEEDGVVKSRLKYIRPTFLQSVVASDGHWLNRPIIPNQLIDGVDIFQWSEESAG